MDRLIAITGAVSAVLLLGSGASYSQEASQSQESRTERALAQCREMSTPELRIACLEAALQSAYGEPQRSTQDRSAPPRPAAADEASQTDADSNSQGLFARLNPFSGRGGGDEAAPARAAPSGAAQATGLGSEQVEARTRRDTPAASAPAYDSLESRIVDVAVYGYASLVVVLDNGQVWRQISADTTRIDADAALGRRVVVREGAISGYRMELRDLSRTIRVERLQ